MNKFTSHLSQLFLICLAFSIPVRVYSQDGLNPFFAAEERGMWVFTLQPVVLPDASSDFLTMARARYSMSTDMSTSLKIGLFGDDLYVGADARYVWLPPIEHMQIESIAGFQSFGSFGLKLATAVSYRLDRVNVFSGLDYQPFFPGGGVSHVLLLPVGAGIPLVNNKLTFTFESGIPISNAAGVFQTVTFGLSYRFN